MQFWGCPPGFSPRSAVVVVNHSSVVVLVFFFSSHPEECLSKVFKRFRDFPVDFIEVVFLWLPLMWFNSVSLDPFPLPRAWTLFLLTPVHLCTWMLSSSVIVFLFYSVFDIFNFFPPPFLSHCCCIFYFYFLYINVFRKTKILPICHFYPPSHPQWGLFSVILFSSSSSWAEIRLKWR